MSGLSLFRSRTVVSSAEIPLLFIICTSLDFSTRTFGVPLGALSASGPNVLPRIKTWAALVMVIAGPTGQFHPKTLGVVPKPKN